MPLNRSASRVVWDALDNDLLVSWTHGCLNVLRDVASDAPHAMQVLIDIIGYPRRELGPYAYANHPSARFALALED